MDTNNTAFLYLHTAYTWMGIRLVRVIFTARIRSLRRLCFHRCLSVHGGVSAPLHAGLHPPGQIPPPGRHPPGRQPTPPPGRHSPLADTPCPVHAGIHTPLCSACWDTVNKRAVRIPLECIFVTHLITWRITKELYILSLITGKHGYAFCAEFLECVRCVFRHGEQHDFRIIWQRNSCYGRFVNCIRY